MQTTFRPSPAFPPVDDLLSTLAAMPWRTIAGNTIDLLMTAAALTYCLGQRARRAMNPTIDRARLAAIAALQARQATNPALAALHYHCSGAVERGESEPIVEQPGPHVLEALPVRELRILARQAGHRALARSGRRADLLETLRNG